MFKKLCIAVAFLLPLSLFAQDMKFGHLDKQELIRSMPEAQAASKALEDMLLKYRTEGTKLEEEFKKEYENYAQNAATMDDAIRTTRENKLKQMQENIQKFGREAEASLEKKQEDLMIPIEKKIVDALTAVGEENGLVYIFDDQMPLYISNKSIDVLPLMKQKLNIK